MMLGASEGHRREENERRVGQAQLRSGTGVVLIVSHPSPGSAWLRNSCCIVTLG